MRSACKAKQFSTFPPHFVGGMPCPPFCRDPFSIPTGRGGQTLNFLFCRMTQNAPIAPCADHIVRLLNKLMVCHGRMASFNHTFDKGRLALCFFCLSSLNDQLQGRWAVFFFDLLQCFTGQMLGDAFVASLALQSSALGLPTVFVFILIAPNLQEEVALPLFWLSVGFAFQSPLTGGGSVPWSQANA